MPKFAFKFFLKIFPTAVRPITGAEGLKYYVSNNFKEV